MSIKEHIAQLVLDSLRNAQKNKLLPDIPVENMVIERPHGQGHGDFACSLPLKLARPMHTDPMVIADQLVSTIPIGESIDRVWAARPGFINFSLSGSWLANQVDTIRQAGATYGNVAVGEGQRAQVEFVSVNPTGPLHVGHARGAVIGSALANILEAAGYEVEREYYINDAGNQIDLFNLSLYARYNQIFGRDVEVPPSGYQGRYMIDLAQEVKTSLGDLFLSLPDKEAIVELGEIGLEKMIASLRSDLELLRVRFDVWFSERSLYNEKQYEKAMKVLDDNGFLVDRDGATWFASSKLGEDKDSVLVRSNGTPTYFASDVAYHYNKFLERKFNLVINIWGADHQGHVPRMKAVIDALGIPLERLALIISQMVTFKHQNDVVKLSKRTGDMVTMRSLVEEVGPDACRFFFLSRSPESQMEFDLELARQQSSDNPVYYIQYAHARVFSILRLSKEKGLEHVNGNLSLLTHDAELALIRKMLELPELVESMARTLEPHHLPHYAVELATASHWFYQQCRVISNLSEDMEITKARLKLVEATGIALSACLNLMNMEAPEQM